MFSGNNPEYNKYVKNQEVDYLGKTAGVMKDFVITLSPIQIHNGSLNSPEGCISYCARLMRFRKKKIRSFPQGSAHILMVMWDDQGLFLPMLQSGVKTV